MPKIVYKLLFAIIVLASCSESRTLQEAETLLETDPQKADSILTSMAIPKRAKDHALYAVLKTQADYKQYKPITSDSLILTATEYYGTRHKSKHAAMAWYTQGCVYNELNNDLAAIESFLKAKDLFPDTLIRYYALSEQKLGNHFLNRMMLEEATQQFRCCHINAERLQDTKMSNYSFFHIGLCALYSRDFILADSIFKIIIDNNRFSFSQRSVATMQLAKICLFYYNDYDNAIKLINTYLEMIKERDYGPGLGVKAEAFYRTMEYDSAYFFFNESMKYFDGIYSRCSNADRLSEITSILGKTDESIYWHKQYGELRDSINEIEKTREIEELQFRHKEELVQEMIANKHRRFIIIGISTLLLLSLSFFLFYSLFKNRERRNIMEKQTELLRQEEEIRKSSIKVLQARVSELSACNQEARLTLLNLYRTRLVICRKRFSQTDAFSKLLSFKLNSTTTLNRNDKNDIFEQLQLSYLETITDIVAEIPDIKEKEIITILLKHLELSNNQISNLFSLTPIAVKQRITRLSKRAPADFLSLFFKAHL